MGNYMYHVEDLLLGDQRHCKLFQEFQQTIGRMTTSEELDYMKAAIFIFENSIDEIENAW